LGFDYRANSIFLNPGDKKYRVACPQGKLLVIVVGPVENNHTVRYQVQLFQEVFVMHFGLGNLNKPSNRLDGINEHVGFQPPFLFPSFFGFLPTPFSTSLNSRMVVESISKTSLKVSPKVRLSDKFYFCIFTHVVVSLQNKLTTWGQTFGE